AAVVAAWLLVHPTVRAAVTRASGTSDGPPGNPPLAALQTMLAVVNLERFPAPDGGWGATLLQGLVVALLLAGAVVWAGPRPRAAPHSSIGGLERTLFALHPALPRHARLYFSDVPQDVGIGHDWFQSAFEIWYRDTTIRAGFLSSYRPRAAAEPTGPDL